MANYLHLKQQFNSNKKFIKQILNDQKCQLRLQAEGLSFCIGVQFHPEVAV